jgi:PKD repeat protein
VLIDLPDLGSLRSRATAINSRLEITGEAVDANLVTHAIRWTVAVVSNPPNVDAGGPYTGTEGTAISFSGSASDANGGTVNVVWDFGDGTSGAGLTSSHVYADNGTYTATLTATGTTGLRASATSAVTVANVPPAVYLVAPSQILSGDTFPLQATFGDPGIRDMPWTYVINWGLGPPFAGSTSSQSDPITANSPRYCAAAPYLLKVDVTDKDGGAGSSTASLTVNRITIPLRVLTETINPRSKGTLGVAVLSTSAIDAREIDVATLTLGDQAGNTVPVARHPNGQFFVSFEDVDHDGRADLVAHFSRESVASSGVLSSPTAMLWTFARLSDGCREVMGNAELRVLDKRH